MNSPRPLIARVVSGGSGQPLASLVSRRADRCTSDDSVPYAIGGHLAFPLALVGKSSSRPASSMISGSGVSALAHKRTCAAHKPMSALPPKADTGRWKARFIVACSRLMEIATHAAWQRRSKTFNSAQSERIASAFWLSRKEIVAALRFRKQWKLREDFRPQ